MNHYIPSQMNDIERFLEEHTTKTKKYVIDKKIKWRVRDMLDGYYGAAEPPVRCGESHLSGLTEPPHFIY